MAASIVARSVVRVSLALFMSGIAVAQSVTPSNATLPTSESTKESVLMLSGTAVFTSANYLLAPLTTGTGIDQPSVQAINIQGNLRLADSNSVGNLTTNDVAFISCDPNGSNIDASTVVGTAGDKSPKAIILYSLTSEECNLNGTYPYGTIFSMVSRANSSDVMTKASLVQSMTNNTIAAFIGPNSTLTGSQSGTTTSSVGGPAPTTAVAMSILYSITGIITLLFLVIIATGAIRAHRNPERYGPRNALAGRPRQSRAKGLARAMLETLPIVKFGDPEPIKPGSRDIELEDGNSVVHAGSEGIPEATPASHTTKEEGHKSPSDATMVASGMGEAQAESIRSGAENGTKEGELGCSICTDDFQTGEDVRVLPCNHKYHPACIDPWLLNVSGTCPLCRHDLRPVTSHTSNTDEGVGNSGDGDLPPPLEAEATDDEAPTGPGSSAASTTPHRPTSRLLDPNRLRHAPPDERIAALRMLRQESRHEGEPAENTEDRSRRARLTRRLRDRFRIKTGPQNTPASSS